ncbi:MAG: hypothetical protein P8Q25_06115 [Porticoccaceae bacterium]|jgi:hypothetical protein|nr:hypothetical protein [Porticoccaceae bacterium]
MATHIPTIGHWYQDIAVHRLFQVIALDEYSATIDIQYEDGEIDELDLDSWSQMTVAESNPPEDWQSLFVLDEEQRLFTDDVISSGSSSDLLTSLEPDSQFGWDEF